MRGSVNEYSVLYAIFVNLYAWLRTSVTVQSSVVLDSSVLYFVEVLFSSAVPASGTWST